MRCPIYDEMLQHDQNTHAMSAAPRIANSLIDNEHISLIGIESHETRMSMGHDLAGTVAEASA